jgi:hypothetical protein
LLINDQIVDLSISWVLDENQGPLNHEKAPAWQAEFIQIPGNDGDQAARNDPGAGQPGAWFCIT